MAPVARRVVAWQRLADELDAGKLASIIREITLAEVLVKAPEVLAEKVRGRLLVNVNA